MRDAELERIEVDLLLEAVYRRYGHDFRDYARASLERRIRQFLPRSGCGSVGEMIGKALRDPEFFARLAGCFSVPVTELFRDPWVFRALREQVVPVLKTWPHFKVWLAGCATGEEAYSLAIVLKEEGLYERAMLYVTDFNEAALAAARDGIYDIAKLREASRNYQQAGGRGSLADYYHAAYGAAAMAPALRERMVFSGHNLAADGAFGEMHLVFCRNVMIYFNRALQNRALSLFTESIAHGGFLCLGAKEDLRFTCVEALYEAVDRKARIYKKRWDAP